MTLSATLARPATLIDDAHVDTRVPYQPYATTRTGKEQDTLKLIDTKGSTDILYYPLVMRWRITPPRLLSLIYFDAVFTLEGTLLDDLCPLVGDKVVTELHAFDAHLHLPPPPDTLRIEKITLEPRRTQAWGTS